MTSSPIVTIFGCGAMASITIPFSKLLLHLGYMPVFACPRDGRYSKLFAGNSSSQIKLFSKKGGSLLNTYNITAFDSLESMAYSSNSFAFVPVENLTNLKNVRFSAVCVDAKNLVSVVDKIDALSTHVMPLYVLANGSSAKDVVFARSYQNVRQINAVIHRTSTRKKGAQYQIECDDIGSIKFQATSFLHNIETCVDGVNFTSVSETDLSTAVKWKFLGCNFPDWIIGLLAEQNVPAGIDMQDLMIGDYLDENCRRQLIPAFALLDHLIADKRVQSTETRYAVMATDTFGRMLKTSQEREDKRDYMRSTALAFLPSVAQLLADNASDDDVVNGLKFILQLIGA